MGMTWSVVTYIIQKIKVTLLSLGCPLIVSSQPVRLICLFLLFSVSVALLASMCSFEHKARFSQRSRMLQYNVILFYSILKFHSTRVPTMYIKIRAPFLCVGGLYTSTLFLWKECFIFSSLNVLLSRIQERLYFLTSSSVWIRLFQKVIACQVVKGFPTFVQSQRLFLYTPPMAHAPVSFVPYVRLTL
jgi:hypothetical protein